MSFDLGTHVGPYKIVEQIGSGGMGEVYRATDTKLGRDIAIKTLPSALAQEPDRLARFKREAKLLATLNHAHIGTIYDFDEYEGSQFIAMELVEGQTLEDRLRSGALSVEDALELALQIAEALEAAHAKGVVHRDLKPANIMLTPESVVKVVDFGLAKALSVEPDDASPAHSPTLSLAMTQQGLILGTAGYMSPEQASGQATDQRADIWALGVVLYEMLTGLPPFSGESVPHVLAAILQAEPNWNGLPKKLHPRLKLMLERCLEKKVHDRYHSVADARVDIEQTLKDPDGAEAHDASRDVRFVRSVFPWVTVSVGLTSVIGVLIAWAFWPASDQQFDEAPDNVKRLAINLGEAETVTNTGLTAHLAFSPDGQRLAYAAQVDGSSQLYLRDLDQLEARSLANTEGAVHPFFSPDGEWVGYFDDVRGNLSKVLVRGGGHQVLTNLVYTGGASWMSDDAIVFAAGDDSVGRLLYRIAATGGTPEVLASPQPETGHTNPEVLPGGETVLLVIRFGALGLGSARDGNIAALSLATNELRTLIERGHTPRYSPTGHILFVRDGDLWAVPFDSERLETTGDPVLVVAGVQQDGRLGGAAYAISNDGMLVYAPGGDTGYGQNFGRLVWVDRDGGEEPLGTGPEVYFAPQVSPDGERLAVAIRSETDLGDIWIVDLESNARRQLSIERGPSYYPRWTQDGQRVVYWAAPTGEDAGLFWQAAGGTREVARLTASGTTIQVPLGFTAGGDLLFEYATSTDDDLYLLSLDEGSEPRPLLDGPYDERDAAISPGGRWMAYSSNESGQFEIYVVSLEDIDGGERWQISDSGGNEPLWSPEGTELFFRSGNGFYAADIRSEGASLLVGAPEQMFTGQYRANPDTAPDYDVSPDGQRFIVFKESEPPSAQASLVAIENWFEELDRLAPSTE